MNLLTTSTNSKKFYTYLFENSDFPFDYKSYSFLLIDIKNTDDVSKVLNFFLELIPDAILVEYEKKYFLFYFTILEYDMESIISSLMEDISSQIKIFSAPRVNPKNKEYFQILINLYNKYLLNKSWYFMNIVDLVSEIILNNINDLKIIKPIILNDLLNDAQMEILIRAMFKNNLNVTQTANDIFMHRNTVIKKLEQIKSITGLNMQKFIDANIMYWILKVK